VNVYLDGVASSTGAATVAGTLTLSRLGSQAANYFAGYQMEDLVYNRGLTAGERRKVEKYLGAKYAISV
jgi:hypothetical protein